MGEVTETGGYDGEGWMDRGARHVSYFCCDVDDNDGVGRRSEVT